MRERLGRAYTSLLAASAMSNLGDGVGVIAWPWLATLLTRDPLAVAFVAAALRLPWLLFTLPAGVLTDRLDRRRIVVAMDALRAVLLALLGLAVWLLHDPAAIAAEGFPAAPLYWLLIATALVVGTAEVLRDNAAQTLMPAIVPPARLESANGRLWSVEDICNALLGPPLGGLLVAAALPLAFFFNAAGFAASALLVLSIPGTFRVASGPRRPWAAEMREGVAFLWRNRLLRDLAMTLGMLNAADNLFLVALVLFAQDVLGLSPEAYGLMLTAGAVGGIAGGLLAETVIRRLGPGLAVRLALLATTAQLAVAALSPVAWPIWVALVAGTFLALVWDTVTVALRQRLVPAPLLGRVNSVYRLFGWGSIPLGILLSGAVVTLAEPLVGRDLALRAPFAAGAILMALWALLVWRRLTDRALTEARFE